MAVFLCIIKRTLKGTFPFRLFIRTEVETRKLEWKSKHPKSGSNDLLYRLNDMISRLNEIFVVLISFKLCFSVFYSHKYKKGK